MLTSDPAPRDTKWVTITLRMNWKDPGLLAPDSKRWRYVLACRSDHDCVVLFRVRVIEVQFPKHW